MLRSKSLTNESVLSTMELNSINSDSVLEVASNVAEPANEANGGGISIVVGGEGNAVRACHMLVSPVSFLGAANDVAEARVVEGVEGDGFPSVFLCPFLMDEPPVQGAYFDVPGLNGQISPQIFEYSHLFRAISTIGVGRSFRSIFHATNRGQVRQDEALTLVR